jgi:hypothetical protein
MLIAVTLLAVQTALLAVDVKVAFDKKFDFKKVTTWAWSEGYGQIMLARHKYDDKEAYRKVAEPIILDAVKTAMTQQGLKPAAGAPPDVTVAYYLLLTFGASTQTIGQFIPPTMEWGLPPFQGATQSLKFMNEGSLVIDLAANKEVIWRGLAQAEIKPDATNERREKLLRESVRDLIKRIPRK